MGNTSNDKNNKNNQINNNSLKNNHKKRKNVTQRLQSLEKTSLIDILLKKFQPSLSEREWIINQRQRNISSITSLPKVSLSVLILFWLSNLISYIFDILYISLSESNVFNVTLDKKKWRKKKRYFEKQNKEIN